MLGFLTIRSVSPISVCRVLSCLFVLQHSDRKQFRDILEDRTALRVEPMMRIVLENTDNAAHHAEATAKTTAIGATMTSVDAEAERANARQLKKKKAAAGKAHRATDLMH